MQHSRRLVPVMGGATALATAVGAFVPATQVALAAPDHPAGATSPLGLTQEGVFESCSAYFGFGKEEGVLGSVAFDVSDAEGDDPGVHAVPDDVEVVLVIETEDEEGPGTLRCLPEEITQAEWEAWVDGSPSPVGLPAWPGPGRYAYPVPSMGPWIDGYGEVTAVGFEVVGLPADHTLVSPQGVKPLNDPFALLFADSEDVPFQQEVDERTVQVIEAGADDGAAAAAAFREATETCLAVPDPFDEDAPTFPLEGALLDAVQAVFDYADFDEGFIGELPSDLSCPGVLSLPLFIQLADDIASTATYTEAIVLAGPVQEPTTSTTAAPTQPSSGAQPVTATPTYTG